jgi:integration host factor subunit beta
LTLLYVVNTLEALHVGSDWPENRSPAVAAVLGLIRGTVGRCPILQESETVTKKEIVKQISDRIGLTQLKTKEIVQQTFDAIVDTLLSERRIELRNFGVFEVKERKPRKARNPRTGDPVQVPAKFVVTFKPGKEMEERVRQLQASAEAAAARRGDEGHRDGQDANGHGDHEDGEAVGSGRGHRARKSS